MSTAFVIALLELILKFGIPGALNIMKAFNKEEITAADIEALRDLVKDPESYLPNDD